MDSSPFEDSPDPADLIYDYLKARAGNKFPVKEIASSLNISRSSCGNSLIRLRVRGLAFETVDSNNHKLWFYSKELETQAEAMANE